ncbi:hypothetical protein NKL05_33705 [Mesorhizobium sp. C420B]|uniref:hypothetical protein n=1 Tax=Mesorhizobium sp. C420B TaxID=2956835 RepID=UPI00333BBAAF
MDALHHGCIHSLHRVHIISGGLGHVGGVHRHVRHAAALRHAALTLHHSALPTLHHAALHHLLHHRHHLLHHGSHLLHHGHHLLHRGHHRCALLGQRGLHRLCGRSGCRGLRRIGRRMVRIGLGKCRARKSCECCKRDQSKVSFHDSFLVVGGKRQAIPEMGAEAPQIAAAGYGFADRSRAMGP